MIKLLDKYDVTDSATYTGADSAALTSIFDYIVRQREFQLSDPRGLYNVFSPNSLLKNQSWRNGDVSEADKFANPVYAGAIDDAGFSFTENGKLSLISARDGFGVLKDWNIEEAFLRSDNGLASRYQASATYNIGATGSIGLNTVGAPTTVQIGDVVSFFPHHVPQYQVTSVTGSNITLDRALEYAVLSGTDLRILAPVIKTGPRALKDALISSGVVKLGTTFDALDLSDTAASLLVRLFIRTENKIKLIDHLNKIMDMCDLYLTVNANNVIDCFRGMQYDGSFIQDIITGDDMVLPINIKFDRSKLFYAFDTLYINSGKVAISSGEVGPDTLSRWAAVDRWQPVSASNNSPLDYQYLYANSTAAGYFGTRRIGYNSVLRAQLSCSLKQYPHSKPRKPFNIALGKQYLIRLDLGNGAILNEPAKVIAYSLDRPKQYYSNVTFEMNNFLYPALPVGR